MWPANLQSRVLVQRASEQPSKGTRKYFSNLTVAPDALGDTYASVSETTSADSLCACVTTYVCVQSCSVLPITTTLVSSLPLPHSVVCRHASRDAPPTCGYVAVARSGCRPRAPSVMYAHRMSFAGDWLAPNSSKASVCRSESRGPSTRVVWRSVVYVSRCSEEHS